MRDSIGWLYFWNPVYIVGSSVPLIKFSSSVPLKILWFFFLWQQRIMWLKTFLSETKTALSGNTVVLCRRCWSELSAALVKTPENWLLLFWISWDRYWIRTHWWVNASGGVFFWYFCLRCHSKLHLRQAAAFLFKHYNSYIFLFANRKCGSSFLN